MKIEVPQNIIKEEKKEDSEEELLDEFNNEKKFEHEENLNSETQMYIEKIFDEKAEEFKSGLS